MDTFARQHAMPHAMHFIYLSDWCTYYYTTGFTAPMSWFDIYAAYRNTHKLAVFTYYCSIVASIGYLILLVNASPQMATIQFMEYLAAIIELLRFPFISFFQSTSNIPVIYIAIFHREYGNAARSPVIAGKYRLRHWRLIPPHHTDTLINWLKWHSNIIVTLSRHRRRYRAIPEIYFIL